MENKKRNIKVILWTIYILIMVVLFILCSVMGDSCGKIEGDGKSSCRVCGRSPVTEFGYCERCTEDFLDWHNEYYD